MPFDKDRHPTNRSVYHIEKYEITDQDKIDANNTVTDLLYRFSISKGKNPTIKAKHVRKNRFRLYFPDGFEDFIKLPENKEDYKEIKPFIEGIFIGDWDVFHATTDWYLIMPDNQGGFLFSPIK